MVRCWCYWVSYRQTQCKCGPYKIAPQLPLIKRKEVSLLPCCRHKASRPSISGVAGQGPSEMENELAQFSSPPKRGQNTSQNPKKAELQWATDLTP